MTENLSIDGINIYYKGNIKQGAVVFIHGGSLNGRIFREQFKNIGAFPMLAIDLPGHGLSEKAKNGEHTYNIPAYAQMVAAVISELELTDFILAGHSLGGNVAIEAAELLPGLKGLFLFNTSPFSLPPQLDKMCKTNPFLGYLLSGSINLEDARLVAGEMLQDSDEMIELLAECMMQADTSTRLGFTASLGLDKFKDEFKLLHNFKKPLAIVQGKSDRFINHSYLSGINPVSLWKNSIIELEAGHIPQMEIPEKFNKLIEEFYRDALPVENHEKKA